MKLCSKTYLEHFGGFFLQNRGKKVTNIAKSVTCHRCLYHSAKLDDFAKEEKEEKKEKKEKDFRVLTDGKALRAIKCVPKFLKCYKLNTA